MQFTYAKPARLLKKIQFLRLKKGSKRLFYPQFIVNYQANTVNRARLGIIVSKRVCKKAVIRNQFKRQIRESFRLHQHTIMPLDYVIIVNQKQATVETQQLQLTLGQAWATLKKV